MADYDSIKKMDPNEFTLEDIEYLLEATGKEEFSEIFSVFEGEGNLNAETINVMSQLIFVSNRKSNPEFTLEDAKRIPLGVFKEMMLSANPTESATPEGD